MKKSEIAMVVLVAAASVMISFFVVSFLANNYLPVLKVDKNGVKVKTTDKITSDVKEPSKDAFNAEAINPTVKTIIGK